ncbi:MAG: bacterioferritin, partial [Calditrichia bacterium]|nr:bacterioferritin [Calditrichia bacterium]
EVLAERILFLGGDIKMDVAEKVKPVKEVKKMLEMGKDMEAASAKDYNIWANECSANADSASKKIFEELVLDEERHYDQFDNELENLEKFGVNYLALQSIERSKNRASGRPTE